jgi:hypothetical protein
MEEQIRRPSIDKSKQNCRSHNVIPTQQAKSCRGTSGKMVCLEQPSSFPRAKLVTSPKQLRASVTERRNRAPARTSWEVKMNIVPNQDLFFVFDDEAVRAMGAAFDQACHSFRNFAHFERVRVLVAKRIIEAAKNGERDPIRLHWQAVMGFSFDEVSIPVDSVRRNLPVPAYAPIARLG